VVVAVNAWPDGTKPIKKKNSLAMSSDGTPHDHVASNDVEHFFVK
jgi:hypothetical protein